MFRSCLKTLAMVGVAALSITILSIGSANASNGGRELRIVSALVNTGIDADARGKAVYRDRSSRQRFKVQVERVTPGMVDLQVDGVSVGTLEVSSLGRGEIQFRNPQGDDPEHQLLNFDPRGKKVDIVQSGQVILSIILPSTATAGGGGNSGGSGGGNSDEMRVSLQATEAAPGASGKAKYRLDRGKARFNVEIEDLAPGNYTLRVDGVVVATITASLVPGTSHVEGEIEFAIPSEPGKQPLTFDPRGKLIEVLSGDTVVLQQMFPAAP
jgi:hypothetical protein